MWKLSRNVRTALGLAHTQADVLRVPCTTAVTPCTYIFFANCRSLDEKDAEFNDGTIKHEYKY